MNGIPITIGKPCRCGGDTFQPCEEDGAILVPGSTHVSYEAGIATHHYKCLTCQRAYTVTMPDGSDDLRLGTWEVIDPPTTRCWECQQATIYLKKSGLCPICHKWIGLLILATEPRHVVRINGYHYLIGAEDGWLFGMRGFDGHEFTIRFFDPLEGEVTTTNLWCQGPIPERFRVRMPDNAEFVGREPPTQLRHHG